MSSAGHSPLGILFWFLALIYSEFLPPMASLSFLVQCFMFAHSSNTR